LFPIVMFSASILNAKNTYNEDLIKNGLGYKKNIDVHLNAIKVNKLSFQIIYSSVVADTSRIVNADNTTVSATTDFITSTNVYVNGLAIFCELVSGTIANGLTDKATYYVTARSDTGFSISTTAAKSGIGDKVDINVSTTGAYTFTPLAISGTFNFKLQGSNDGTNFSDLYVSSSTGGNSFNGLDHTSPCSKDFTSTAGTTIWSLGEVFFSHLRFTITRGTWGAVNIKAILAGRED